MKHTKWVDLIVLLELEDERIGIILFEFLRFRLHNLFAIVRRLVSDENVALTQSKTLVSAIVHARALFYSNFQNEMNEMNLEGAIFQASHENIVRLANFVDEWHDIVQDRVNRKAFHVQGSARQNIYK